MDNSQKTRIGIVTGGGDCPGLNAVIRAVAKAAARRGWEAIGILGGFEGLLAPTRHRPLDYHEIAGTHHFSITNAIASKGHPMRKLVLGQMGLTG